MKLNSIIQQQGTIFEDGNQNFTIKQNKTPQFNSHQSMNNTTQAFYNKKLEKIDIKTRNNQQNQITMGDIQKLSQNKLYSNISNQTVLINNKINYYNKQSKDIKLPKIAIENN